MAVLVSNPPFNLKWTHPPFAICQPRFASVGEVPPESNANFVFVLTALEIVNRAIFILPNGVLTSDQSNELAIRKTLIEKNWIESVIALPDKMFENTSIPTCIIVFNKAKTTKHVAMIDAREIAITEERLQNGQFGGSSHTKRTYKKTINILDDEAIRKIVNKDEAITRMVSAEEIQKQGYALTPSRYFEIEIKDESRNYEDIVKDINHIRTIRNRCKLTINESIAKTLGLNMFDDDASEFEEIEKMLGLKIIKNDYVRYTKNKNEIMFSNNDKQELSHILKMIIPQFKAMIYHLNEEENIYLAELRDKLLTELMNGTVSVESEEQHD